MAQIRYADSADELKKRLTSEKTPDRIQFHPVIASKRKSGHPSKSSAAQMFRRNANQVSETENGVSETENDDKTVGARGGNASRLSSV